MNYCEQGQERALIFDTQFFLKEECLTVCIVHILHLMKTIHFVCLCMIQFNNCKLLKRHLYNNLYDTCIIYLKMRLGYNVKI